MSLHGKLNVKIFLMFIVAENTRCVNILYWHSDLILLHIPWPVFLSRRRVIIHVIIALHTSLGMLVSHTPCAASNSGAFCHRSFKIGIRYCKTLIFRMTLFSRGHRPWYIRETLCSRLVKAFSIIYRLWYIGEDFIFASLCSREFTWK